MFQVMRLESQVKRYKSQAEAAVSLTVLNREFKLRVIRQRQTPGKEKFYGIRK